MNGMQNLTMAQDYDHAAITIPGSGDTAVTFRSLLPSALRDKIKKSKGVIGAFVEWADDEFVWGKTVDTTVLHSQVLDATAVTSMLDIPVNGPALLDSFVKSADASTVAANLIVYLLGPPE